MIKFSFSVLDQKYFYEKIWLKKLKLSVKADILYLQPRS